MKILSGVTIIFVAISSVIFLFVMDYYFRLQEARAENARRQAARYTEPGIFAEVPEEGDESNLAA